MRRRLMKKNSWCFSDEMCFVYSGERDANVICIAGTGRSRKTSFEKTEEIRRNKIMKNEMNKSDQVVITEKGTILIEKQEAPEKSEHLVAYKNMILK